MTEVITNLTAKKIINLYLYGYKSTPDNLIYLTYVNN